MQNQSPFVKTVIWFMVFLMSVGFLALVIQPFVGGSLFGSGDGRGATQELLDDARADVRADKCTAAPATITGKRQDRCVEALIELGSNYATLAQPPTQTSADDKVEIPKDAQRSTDRAIDAYKAAYKLAPNTPEAAETYAGYLIEQGKAQEALPVWTALVKQNPAEEDYLLQQAGAFSQTNDTAKAIEAYQVFLKKFPESGQVDAIKDQIKTLEEQAKAAASGGGGAGNLPINVG